MNYEFSSKGVHNGAGKFEMFSTLQVPPSAGCWRIGGNFCLNVQRRPRWLTRKLIWWLLEWKWEDV